VFGVTFHDVQPWFGVIVQWNGLVYAESLLHLARYRPADGSVNWALLGEALARHAMQEQADSGPHLGMYPDAFSPVKGDEEYTWWLNPQLVGRVTFPLAGLPLGNDPRVLARGGASRLHLTSGATILEARQQEGRLRVLLADDPGEASYTLIASAAAPSKVMVEGAVLPEVSDLDSVDAGWRWLQGHNTALLKLTARQGVTAAELLW
jgi:hypothetical protein